MMNKTDSFFKSFSLMSLITFFSRILGYIRDLFFAFLLGVEQALSLRKEALSTIYLGEVQAHHGYLSP